MPSFADCTGNLVLAPKGLIHVSSVRFCIPHTPRVITDCWQAIHNSETKKYYKLYLKMFKSYMTRMYYVSLTIFVN